MHIRPYQSGDETTQVAIYNAAAASLPGFKPASAEEVARRYRSADADPAAKLYAVDGDEMVGYAVFNPNGRISYPWCRPQCADVREPLLEAILATMRQRGHAGAWATYRGDWEPVLSFFRTQRFRQVRTMINYVAERVGLPRSPVPAGQVIRPLERGDLPGLIALGGALFAGLDRAALEEFFWSNPYFSAADLFALVPVTDPAELLGVALLIANAGYADPTRIDPAMPCFRLGALGTERERHKRVNGLFSCLFAEEKAGEALLAEAAGRLEQAGVAHVAAQAASDQPALLGFYDRFWNRQGSFPILARSLNA